MPRIPLEKRMKRRKQLEMARTQDVLVDFVVALPRPAVFHGGTAIWRVYGGRRFSEDLDLYFTWRESRWIKEKLGEFLEPYGIELRKFRDTGNTLFIEVSKKGTNVKLELSNQKKEGILGNYERVDGTYVSVFTLTPEELFSEKVSAYLSRRLVRDLYDIAFLYPLCEKSKIIQDIQKLQTNLRPPKDEEVLKTLVIDGIAPTFEQMKKTIMRW